MGNKDKQRLKRKRKQREARKQQNRGLASLLRDAVIQECYITGAWKEQGIAAIWLFVSLPGGRLALVSYLVDLWCCGLKDSFVRMDFGLAERAESLARSRRAEFPQIPASLGLVRRLVAGAVRYSMQNRFRLPNKCEHHLALLGLDPAKCLTADLSDFGTEDGKLRFVGTEQQLRRLYMGSFEEFLSRKDAEVCFQTQEDIEAWENEARSDQDEADEEEEEDEPAEVRLDDVSDEDFRDLSMALDASNREVAAKARQWCCDRGIRPSEKLDEAVSILMLVLMLTVQEFGDTPSAHDLALRLATERARKRSAETVLGIDQMNQFLASDEGGAHLQAMIDDE